MRIGLLLGGCALVACHGGHVSTNGVQGAEPWGPFSIAAAILMTTFFLGAPIAALIIVGREKKRKK